jgi:hypothetical protein
MEKIKTWEEIATGKAERDLIEITAYYEQMCDAYFPVLKKYGEAETDFNIKKAEYIMDPDNKVKSTTKNEAGIAAFPDEYRLLMEMTIKKESFLQLFKKIEKRMDSIKKVMSIDPIRFNNG